MFYLSPPKGALHPVKLLLVKELNKAHGLTMVAERG